MPTRLAIRIQERLDALTPQRAGARFLSPGKPERHRGPVRGRAFAGVRHLQVDHRALLPRPRLRKLRGGAAAGARRTEPAAAGGLGGRLPRTSGRLARGLPGGGTHRAGPHARGPQFGTLRAAVERLALADRSGCWRSTTMRRWRRSPKACCSPCATTCTCSPTAAPRPSRGLPQWGRRHAALHHARASVGGGAICDRAGVLAGATLIVLTNIVLASPIGADLVIRCHARSGLPDGSLTPRSARSSSWSAVWLNASAPARRADAP